MDNSSYPEVQCTGLNEALVNHLRDVGALDYFSELVQAGRSSLVEELQQILNIQKARELISPAPLP